MNIYQGDLSMESMNELDRWMLPLSSGYLVKHNASQEAAVPCRQPSILEVNMVSFDDLIACLTLASS